MLINAKTIWGQDRLPCLCHPVVWSIVVIEPIRILDKGFLSGIFLSMLLLFEESRQDEGIVYGLVLNSTILNYKFHTEYRLNL
jgi:hypothetical protein